MIRLLKGTVEGLEERAVILLVNGVGYHVLVPSDILQQLSEASNANLESGSNNIVTLHIHTHVREDIISLYGFRTKKELSFFELLLTTNGIGPKMALEILNQPSDTVQTAIFTGDVTKLTKIPGIGKKIAERLILELKGKVEPSDINARKHTPLNNRVFDADAVRALEGLGYKKVHIEKVLSEMEEDLKDSESIIRYFLQRV